MLTSFLEIGNEPYHCFAYFQWKPGDVVSDQLREQKCLVYKISDRTIGSIPRVWVNVLDFQLQWKNFCLWLLNWFMLFIPLEKKHVLFFSPASLSDHPPPHPHPLAHSLSGLSCHSHIALRSLFCISCRLQLCSSFLCSLLVRYRYHFSLSNMPLSVCLSFMLKAA